MSCGSSATVSMKPSGAPLVHLGGGPAMTKTHALLDGDAVTEFRERLRNARSELLRTVLLTGDEMRGLGDREPGTLIEDSARGVMSDLVASLNGRERRELEEIQEAMA